MNATGQLVDTRRISSWIQTKICGDLRPPTRLQCHRPRFQCKLLFALPRRAIHKTATLNPTRHAFDGADFCKRVAMSEHFHPLAPMNFRGNLTNLSGGTPDIYNWFRDEGFTFRAMGGP